ncbi:unnamed protein product, partial [Cyprideis torosa]
LAGFSGPHSSNHLWRSTCSQFREYLGDPYLSALFAFLTSSDESTFKEILRNPALYLRDRLSLAISFLSDVELLKFLESLRAIKKEKGDLEGLVLLGFSTQVSRTTSLQGTGGAGDDWTQTEEGQGGNSAATMTRDKY